MINELNNLIRQAAQMASQGQATTRIGLVTSYDPNTYSAKVMLQPESIETGWLPIATMWVGNGWGMFCPPTSGDMVQIEFQEGGIDAGLIVGRFFNDSERPLNVPSGEFWLQHKSGSLLKFHNDGSIEVSATAGITYTAASHAFKGPVTMDKTLQVTQDVTAGGNVSDQSGSKGTMQTIRDKYDAHTHGGVQSGSSNTSTPSNSL